MLDKVFHMFGLIFAADIVNFWILVSHVRQSLFTCLVWYLQQTLYISEFLCSMLLDKVCSHVWFDICRHCTMYIYCGIHAWTLSRLMPVWNPHKRGLKAIANSTTWIEYLCIWIQIILQDETFVVTQKIILLKIL